MPIDPIDSMMPALGLMVVSIIIATHGGRMAAHREFTSRFLSLRGAAAVAVGGTLLVAGLVGFALALYVGLGVGAQ